jgi:methoxymalonate biosynthesis protein
MTPIKCVVWDLDGTVWDGIAIEARPGEAPEPFPEVLRAMEVLEQRGIVNSLASRTDPSVGDLVRHHPQLAQRFVAPQFGWGSKSEAIQRIADELGLQLNALALVDDSPFERANTAAMLSDVVVLEPEEMLNLLDSPLFRPAVVTEEARHRVARYREEQARQQARAQFAGSQNAFFKWCQIRMSIAPACPADVDRLVELSERTHRLNSISQAFSREHVSRLVTDPRWFVPVVRLTDRFGGYGLIGAAFIERDNEGDNSTYRLLLLTISCRIAGRGVATAFLRWIMDAARASGATRLVADVRHTNENLPLRLLFRQFGFQVLDMDDEIEPARALMGRVLTEAFPDYPEWLEVVENS